MAQLLWFIYLTALVVANPLPYDNAASKSEELYPRQGTSCASVNAAATIPSTTQLPDPFHFLNGQPVTTAQDFACRQKEVSTLIQGSELGNKPPAPDKLTASLSGNTLSITTTVNGKSITFTPTITYPTSGTAPFPAVIGIDGINIPLPPGVATINLNVDDLAQQNNAASRGQGKFYTLYPNSATANPAGALAAWAWGVSRVVDALEQLPQSQTRLNPARLGVSGCSRNGKGAMVAGALEPRIALTIPQESGSGGAACWRLSDYELNVQKIQTQTAGEIIGENAWFGPTFDKFASKTNGVDVLPFDHHLLAQLVAPRPLFVIENSDYVWLGSWSTYGCMKAAQTAWTALGVADKMGFWELGGHAHCSFPAAQQGALFAYINRFLLDRTGQNTTVFATDANSTSSFTIPGSFANWSVPRLQ